MRRDILRGAKAYLVESIDLFIILKQEGSVFCKPKNLNTMSLLYTNNKDEDIVNMIAAEVSHWDDKGGPPTRAHACDSFQHIFRPCTNRFCFDFARFTSELRTATRRCHLTSTTATGMVFSTWTFPRLGRRPWLPPESLLPSRRTTPRMSS